MTGGKYNIEMTAEEAKLFVEYQKHRGLFLKLLDTGVFDTKNGQVTIDFNSDGTMMQVQRRMIMYRKKTVL